MIIPQANRLQKVEEYYFSKKLKQIQELKVRGIEVINLGIGNPDMSPHISVIEQLSQAAQNCLSHGYQSYKGSDQLRMAMCNWYDSRYGVRLDINSEVLPLMGSKEGIMHISMAFLNRGDKVLVPNPGYPTYSSVSKLLQAQILSYDLKEENHWEPDFKTIEKEDLSRVKIMWVNYPNMPTGKNATVELFQKLVDFGKKHKMLIINDNPYSFILNDNPLSILSIERSKEVVLELNSLSKSFNMAGWRVGMVVGDQEYIQNILKVKSNMDSGMFLPLQKGAIKALELSDDWFAMINREYKDRRDIVYELLDVIGCSYDKNQTGMFVWAKLPNDVKGEDWSEVILDRCGVFITPGFIFGSNGSKYIRISLCSNREVLQKAKNRISNINGLK